MTLARLFGEGSIYHVYNRGNRKQQIFYDNQDHEFFLGRLIKYSNEMNLPILCYCLMYNHWHLCLKQSDVKSPTDLFRKLNTSYAMYFNKKYKTVGHLYQGKYKYKLVLSNYYLSHLSFYIHNNPWEGGIESPETYFYSSLRDYKKGFSEFCELKPVLDQFSGSPAEYMEYFELFQKNKIPRIS